MAQLKLQIKCLLIMQFERECKYKREVTANWVINNSIRSVNMNLS